MKTQLEDIYSSFATIQAVGIDGTSKQKFDEILDEELSLIQRKIENNSYEFSFYKQKLLVKSVNKNEPIGLLTSPKPQDLTFNTLVNSSITWSYPNILDFKF